MSFVISWDNLCRMSNTTAHVEGLFVYGTLRHSQPNHRLVHTWDTPAHHDALAPDLALYLPSHRHFPYATWAPTTHGTAAQGVHGDLLPIPTRDWPHAREILDRLEGYNPDHEDHSHYLLRKVTVTSQDRTLQAWTYLAGPRVRIDQLLAIPSGIWPPATPHAGNLLITPDTRATITPHRHPADQLDGPVDAVQIRDNQVLWLRTDHLSAPGLAPNPLANLLAGPAAALELVNGPVMVTAGTPEAPRQLSSHDAAEALERALQLAAHTELLDRITAASTVQRDWFA